jgi:hypothetical protein
MPMGFINVIMLIKWVAINYFKIVIFYWNGDGKKWIINDQNGGQKMSKLEG